MKSETYLTTNEDCEKLKFRKETLIMLFMAVVALAICDNQPINAMEQTNEKGKYMKHDKKSGPKLNQYDSYNQFDVLSIYCVIKKIVSDGVKPEIVDGMDQENPKMTNPATLQLRANHLDIANVLWDGKQ